MAYKNRRVVVIIPAYNEQQSITQVVTELLELPEANSSRALVNEVLVCDNASTDNTASLARAAGATVLPEPRAGYGYACLRCIAHLPQLDLDDNDFVIFVDGDYSVVSTEISLILNSLDQGNDLVIGNRNNPQQETAALGQHQRFGNWLASLLIRFIWRVPVYDLGPFRGLRYAQLRQLNMRDKRFGWTVEMQVKAIQLGYHYAEVAVSTRKRLGESKISGTVRGTIGAGLGIFGKIFTLYWQQRRFVRSAAQSITNNTMEQL